MRDVRHHNRSPYVALGATATKAKGPVPSQNEQAIERATEHVILPLRAGDKEP